ncbi:hypothetical protein LguiA_022106 [Lonicera macranthoides]
MTTLEVYLPEEVVYQILSWLPPKSLLRFRCVCKSWYSLISSPNFINIHTRNLTYITSTRKLIRHCTSTSRREEVYSVFLDNQWSFDRDDDIKIDFPFPSSTKYTIVGHCNGLICLSDDAHDYAIKIVLWNPAIRRKLILPLPNIILNNMGYMYVLGFGFDCKANDYKIVRLCYENAGDSNKLPPLVEVYSVKTGAWRGITAPAPVCHITGYFLVQGFVNGAAHWVAYPQFCGQMRSLILSFDMCNEVFREIMLPKCLAVESPWYMGAVTIQDSLSVVEYDRSFSMLSVWVMKEYGVVESWTKRYNIDTKVGLGIMLGVRRNGEVLLTTRNEELVEYDVQTRGSMDLITYAMKNSFFVDTYKESFALLFEGEKTHI